MTLPNIEPEDMNDDELDAATVVTAAELIVAIAELELARRKLGAFFS